MKYEDCKPYITRLCQAWQIKLKDGTRKMLLLDKGFTFDEVHQYCLVHHGEFELSQVAVGEVTFDLKKGDSTYSADARAFDEKRNFAPLANL